MNKKLKKSLVYILVTVPLGSGFIYCSVSLLLNEGDDIVIEGVVFGSAIIIHGLLLTFSSRYEKIITRFIQSAATGYDDLGDDG